MRYPSGGYTLDFIQSMLSEESGQVRGWFNNLELRSVFQPAFSLPHKRAFGFEANLRGSDPNGRPVSPNVLFGPVKNYSETSLLDMLCMTMHMRNFFSRDMPPGLLLFNLHPEVFIDFGNSSKFLAALFRHYHVSGDRVMIDIPGSALAHEQLAEAIGAYRELGCLISVDNFGVDNTDLDSVLRAAPAIVKIGNSVIADAVTDQDIRRNLPEAVSMLHEMGTLVLMEGIESETEALIAIDADADFGSGYFFGPLQENIRDFNDPGEILNDIWRTYKKQYASTEPVENSARATLNDKALHSSLVKRLRETSPAEIERYREERRPFISALQQVASRLASGEDFATCCEAILKMKGAIRCFILDDEGIQIGEDAVSSHPPSRSGLDVNRLVAGTAGNWSRRHFFRRAIWEQEVVQVTRKYCSLSGYRHCVTFSIATKIDGTLSVICCDIDWTFHHQSINDGPFPAVK